MRTATLTVVLLAAGHSPGQEVLVPSFHTEKAKASYVLAVPPGHQATKATPLILDFHGAIHPSRKGANVTYHSVWSKFVKAEPLLVLGLNARTRAWNMTKGEKDDTAYALHVLREVGGKNEIAQDEIYLAGFSSGSDFLCKGGIQLRGKFAGSLVVCPGPPNVLGIRGKELLRAKDHPFYFVTGEKDYIRKAGAWQAYLTLSQAGGRVMYREVPDVAHSFPPISEYQRCFHFLRVLAGRAKNVDVLKLAEDAFRREDYLLASTLAKKAGVKGRALLPDIEKRGQSLLRVAERVSWKDAPGLAFETWWRLQTQFHLFPALAARAQAELAKDHGLSNRDMMRARRDHFRSRGRSPVPVTPAAKPKDRQPARPPQPARRSGAARIPKKSAQAVGPWSFDRYLSHDEVTQRLQLLASQNPQRVRLHSMGKSIGGRDLWVCEITDDVDRAGHKPAIYVQGGLHGNEISAVMTTLYFAWQMGANPDRRRSIDRLLRDTTFYVAPAVNPDAVQHFVTRPNSMWRPRFNFRPHDADGDGRIDEDGYEDLNGDGEISQMYVVDPQGTFVLKEGRMVRDRTGKVAPRFRHVGREGLDDDGDGKFSEDPIGGVNLNRNFPVGFRARRDFEGFRGTGPGSEPETQAIMKFVRGHPNINVFFDYHNAANCVFYWVGPDGQAKDPEDFARMAAIAGRAKAELGFAPRPLNHSGVGLSIAWAYGELHLPACIVELEKGDAKAWGGEVFVKATKFQHPQLGEVWIGNDDKKLPKRNPPPSGIYAQARAHWEFMRDELKELPKLGLDQPRIVRTAAGFRVTGFVANTGKSPFDSSRARRLGKAADIRLSARGAAIAGTTALPSLVAGERRAFAVELTAIKESVTLVVAHPKGGTLELAVRRPRVATVPIRERADYPIEAGYRTVDDVATVGVTGTDNGPAFRVTHRNKALRVAVLLGEFADLRHTVPASAFEESLFGEEYRGRSHTGQPVYGSLRDFYREMSYGKMQVTGAVFDWIRLPGKYADYRSASFGSSKFRTELEAGVLARDGAEALDGFDGMVFVWAGNPVRRTSCLWPMRLSLKHRPGVVAFKTGEFYRGQMAPIGVACHEMGHTFGVNDKYGLGAPRLPLGRWCLMCKGTHGSGQSMHHRPLHLCAWCKMNVGWVQPVVVGAATKQRVALRPILSFPRECLRVLLKPDGSEYVLLTNRRQEGFLTELPSPGLVVLRVGPNTRPSAPQKQVQLLPAHGLGPARKSELQKLDQVAWPQPGKTEVIVRSEDDRTAVRIGNIRRADDVVYFDLSPAN